MIKIVDYLVKVRIINEINPAKGSVRSKRNGRGNATGQGRTAGKGHKGYKSDLEQAQGLP